MSTKTNMQIALGIFIEAMRSYIVKLLRKEAGDNWAELYYDSLTSNQRESWDRLGKDGSSSEARIDYHHLKGFSLKYKDLLRPDFDKKVNNLPTWFEQIADARHKCNHYQEMDDVDIQNGFNNMILVIRELKMEDVEKEINVLREGKSKKKIKVARKKSDDNGLVPWFKNVTPHIDIKQGQLDESVFAADLAEVALGGGREIYQNSAVFFSKTYFTQGLKSIAKRVIKGLNGGEDAENRVVSLQTGFGGGKTHTLISLYHIARGGKKTLESSETKELIDYTGEPQFENARTAVFTNTTNDPTQGRVQDGITIKTLWGELAYQLGGKEAYELIRANDENRTTPKGLFKKILTGTMPSLILIDELADYCVAASGVTVGSSTLSDQTVSFMQELSEAVAATDRCVLVSTLPASVVEVAASPQSAQILTSLSNRIGRIGADTTPVADDEIFEVIRRRLFEDLGDPEQLGQVISAYMMEYQKLWTEIPAHAVKPDYKERMLKSYPFHPELIDMFRVRWASNHDFQRTRGVLRLLASIVADLWKRQGSLTGTNALIHTSDVNFENLDALSGQLKKLYGNGYDAVITADVSGSSSNAFRIDMEKHEYGTYSLTQGIAASIILGSFGSTVNKGLDVKELKLCILKPQSFNHNSVNGALDMLEAHAHYLYYSSAGSESKRYWFHTKPNINILINQAKKEVNTDESNKEILTRINKIKNNVTLFNVLVNPTEDIPDQDKPTLIILGPDYLVNPEKVPTHTENFIKKVALKKGNSERIYRNTILFLLCSEMGYSRLSTDIINFLACQKIQDEYHGQLDKDQKEDIKKKIDDYSKQSDSSLVSAYSMIVKYSAKMGIDKLLIKQFRDNLDYQINNTATDLLKNEEWLLDSVGLGILRNNNLVPTVTTPVEVKKIYQAFLKFDDKPMISGKEAIESSLLRYCHNGEFGIASGDGISFNKIYYQEQVPYFDVEDTTYWLVDKSLANTNTPDEQETITAPSNTSSIGGDRGIVYEPQSKELPEDQKVFKSVSISGKVNLENYAEIFRSFVQPLRDNNVEIEIRIKGKSTEANQITENSNQYKITKESARQLGLYFEVEE